ncbi:uncharacterized protein LOC129575592 [Sitodiplosis mosellana]|uniref:uncharacterized protein LOC129575592 n=1 Tax=Sitodiplosis mosellana TaxID=263140 RepID=UPI002444BC38|nr:uncharacterized protein LOC129575592 [Sitodiplosis mosellana]
MFLSNKSFVPETKINFHPVFIGSQSFRIFVVLIVLLESKRLKLVNMKLILYVVAVGFVQVCFSAVVVKREEKPNDPFDETIDELRTVLKAVHGTNPQAVENFINNLNGFRDEATDGEALNSFLNLLSLAVNADVSKLNQTLQESPFFDSSEEDDGDANEDPEQINSNLAQGFSKGSSHNKALDRFKEAVSKAWTESQTKRAMELLQGFSQNATPMEKENAYRKLIISAARNALGIKTLFAIN